MQYPFIIPLSYQNLFKRLGPRAAQAFITDQMTFTGSYPADLSIPFDGLVAYFLKSCTSATYLRRAFDLLNRDDLRQLRRIARKGAVDPGDRGEDREACRSLAARGLVFAMETDGEKLVSTSVEICLGVPFDDGEQTHSLLLSLNRYPQEVIKSISRLRGESNGGSHKIRMAAHLYESTIDLYPVLSRSLPQEELAVLRRVFRKGCRLWLSELFPPPAGEQTPWMSSCSYEKNDPYLFLYSPRHEDEKDLPVQSRLLLRLVAKGFLAFQHRNYPFSGDHEVFIPVEGLTYVSEIFFAEMDRERASIEKEMYGEEQKEFCSYSERILQDVRKVQAAAACGLVERKVDGEVKKAALTRIGRLINGDEAYVDHLLRVFSSFIYTPLLNVQRASKPDRKTETVPGLRETLVAAVQGSRLGWGILKILLPLAGWIKADALRTYLANHRDLFDYSSSMTDAKVAGQLDFLYLCGILEISPDRAMIRVSPRARGLLEKDETDQAAVIPEGEKCLIVQGNLEILVPAHVHVTVLRSLSSFATLTVLDQMLHFTLSKTSLIKAAEKGWGHKKILAYLATHAAAGVPQPVERFIQTMGAKQGEAVIAPAVALIRCSGLGIREKLLAMKELHCYALPGTEEYLCVVGGQASHIERMLKRKGIFAEVKDMLS